MAKSRDAFRTISEVSEWLDTPAHVLRFWESKFSQVKPVKRAGGRRYYRPEDMELLAGIKTLLHEQGMTIKGAQKLLREKGVKHVASLGPGLDDEGTIDANPTPDPVATPPKVEISVGLMATPTGADDSEAETPDTPKDPEDEAAPPARVGLGIGLAAQLPDDPAEAPDNVVRFDATPAATPPPAHASPRPTVPADPDDMDYNPPSRVFSALQRADRAKLARKASSIAPLVARLDAVRASISRD